MIDNKRYQIAASKKSKAYTKRHCRIVGAQLSSTISRKLDRTRGVRWWGRHDVLRGKGSVIVAG